MCTKQSLDNPQSIRKHEILFPSYILQEFEWSKLLIYYVLNAENTQEVKETFRISL